MEGVAASRIPTMVKVRSSLLEKVSPLRSGSVASRMVPSFTRSPMGRVMVSPILSSGWFSKYCFDMAISLEASGMRPSVSSFFSGMCFQYAALAQRRDRYSLLGSSISAVIKLPFMRTSSTVEYPFIRGRSRPKASPNNSPCQSPDLNTVSVMVSLHMVLINPQRAERKVLAR